MDLRGPPTAAILAANATHLAASATESALIRKLDYVIHPLHRPVGDDWGEEHT